MRRQKGPTSYPKCHNYRHRTSNLSPESWMWSPKAENKSGEQSFKELSYIYTRNITQRILYHTHTHDHVAAWISTTPEAFGVCNRFCQQNRLPLKQLRQETWPVSFGEDAVEKRQKTRSKDERDENQTDMITLFFQTPSFGLLMLTTSHLNGRYIPLPFRLHLCVKNPQTRRRLAAFSAG